MPYGKAIIPVIAVVGRYSKKMACSEKYSKKMSQCRWGIRVMV